MLEKLPDISKALLLLTSALYLLGFVCVTSYLSRFGFVTFDVLNARFLIAGIYPAAGIATALLIAWARHDTFINRDMVGLTKAGTRFEFVAGTVSLIFFSSAILQVVFSFGRYRASAPGDLIEIQSWSRFDFVGALIGNLRIGLPADIQSILQLVLYIFCYAVFLLGPLIIAIKVKSAFDARTSKPETATVIVDDSAKTKPVKLWAKTAYYLLDCLSVSVLVALFAYSARKMQAGLYDFSFFLRPHKLEMDIIFSWLYLLFVSSWGLFVLSRNKKFPESVQAFKEPFKLQEFAALILVPVLGALYTFGAAIFPLIPFATGGGEPREVQIVSSAYAEQFSSERTFLIGESEQFFFLIASTPDRARALQFNKGDFALLELKSSFLRIKPTVRGR